MSDDEAMALADMAYYEGAKHMLSAMAHGRDPVELWKAQENRVKHAKQWLAEKRHTLTVEGSPDAG